MVEAETELLPIRRLSAGYSKMRSPDAGTVAHVGRYQAFGDVPAILEQVRQRNTVRQRPTGIRSARRVKVGKL